LEIQSLWQRQACHEVAVRLLVLRVCRTKEGWLKKSRQGRFQEHTQAAQEEHLPLKPLGYPALRCQGADSLCGAYSGEAVVKY
jgi:hypothetical protein